ncbi:uncharacterized protein LOC129583495 isoform X2 [Paramacrobiotus metropolitanus]|uniref:uncharacterized protein LOC129583495 isoform X2 n=1 Tax=Paramacrobiotus metropolitanus TaxID=2943436 RepID=UPI0024461D5C|nr:uncharacterized protein LOC129583495 isoform X2 [Paramacrobiotus metropolitanus]
MAGMIFSLGTMPRYQRMFTDVNQISCQNTVLVRNDDDSWWLGYIQEMDGDQVFIYFDSTKIRARWIHLRSIWSFPFYWTKDARDKQLGGSYNVPVFVALRDEDNGPFCFRPAVMLRPLWCCEFLYGICFIRTDGGMDNAYGQRPRLELVDHGQVVYQLPPTGPSLFERRSGLIFTKHFIPLARAQALLGDASDKFRIVKHLCTALREELRLPCPSASCRFHLRIQEDCSVIIIIGCTTDPLRPPLTTSLLLKVLETHLTSRAELPPIANRMFCASESVPFEEEDELLLTASIRDLTPSLLSEIFIHLDLHSQMRTKRVCALWQLLLSSPRMAEHISISFESCWHLKVDNGNCYKAATLLCRSINTTTVSLTILRVPPPNHRSFLNTLLKTMETKLSLIVFKDHTYNEEPKGTLHDQQQSRLKHTAMIELTIYKHTCNYVVLHNWKVSVLFGPLMYQVFELPSYREHSDGVTAMRRLPAHEWEFMKRLTRHSHELNIDNLQIRIPRLLLKCSDGKLHMASRFMCALNDNFPPVTADMLTKVTTVHDRWVRSLAYPDDWQAIRNFLRLFSGFQPDGRPQMWNDVDLRLLDITKLSKMAVYGIDELFHV